MEHEAALMDLIINPYVIPHYVSYAILASLILIVTALVIRGAMALVPKGVQNLVETVAEAMLKLSEENIGHHWYKTFFPWLGSLFMYILICNFMGLIPGFVSPTSNINVTASMAVPVFLLTHIYGIRVHGFGYVKHFAGPIRSALAIPLMALMFVIEVIGHLARPLTLSVRLFGNMVAKHMLLFALGLLAPAVVPVLILGLGVLVSVIQAFVFTLLATLYFAGAVEEAH